MTVANVNVTKVLLKRGNTAQNNNYTGVNGELTIDTQAATLRIHDGSTQGGTVITATGAVGAYSNTNAAAYLASQNITSANIGAYQTFANANAVGQTTEINSLRANITAANAAITGLQSNASVQAALLDTLTGNAATQADTLNTLLSNAIAQQTSLIDLVANAATQAQAIANVSGTYSNANVSSYLSTFTGNIAAGNVITNNFLYANGLPYVNSGVQASYYRGYRPTQQGSITVGTAVAFYGTETSVSNDITLDANNGNITLQPNKTYRIRGTIGSIASLPSGTTVGYQWYNASIGQYLGNSSVIVSDESNASYALAGGTAETIFTPSTITNVQLRVSSITGGGVSFLGVPNIGSPWFDIEVIGGYSPLITSYNNANVALYLPTDATIISLQNNAASQTTEINSLRANITAANSAITSLTSNAAIQAALLDTLTGNAATQSTVLDTLTTNAATQATTLTNLLSNAVAQQTSLIDLVANAATQAQFISNTNANTKSYLAAFDGNIIPAANVTYSLGDSTHQWKDLWVSNNTIYIGGTPVRVDGETLLINNLPISSASIIGNLQIDNNNNQLSFGPGESYSFLNMKNDGSETRLANDNGNVQISTTKQGPGGGTYYWTFSDTGNILLPNNSSSINYANGVSILSGLGGAVTGNIAVGSGAIQFIANSSGDGNGYATMRLIPDIDREFWDQYLIVDPTAPGHIHIRAGGTQDNSNADLILGGENSHLRVTAGSNPPVYIKANSASWAFGVDSSLSMPTGGNLYFDNSAVSVIDGVTNINAVGTVGANVIQVLSDLTSFGASPAPRIYGFSSIATTGSAVNEGNISASGNLVASRNAYVTGNVFAARYNFANGVNILSTVGAGSYGNTQVAAYLPAYTGNVGAARVQVTNAVDFMYGGYPYMGWQLSGSDTLKLRTNIASGDYTDDAIIVDRQSLAVNVVATLTAGNIVTTNGLFWSNGVAYSSGGAASTGNITFNDTTISTTGGAGQGIILNSAGSGEIAMLDYVGVNNTNPGYWLHVGDGAPGAVNNTGNISIDYNNGLDSSRASTIIGYAWWDAGGNGNNNRGIGAHRQFGIYKNDDLYTTKYLEIDLTSGNANLTNIAVSRVTTTNGVFWANGVAFSTGGSTYGNTEVAAYLLTYPNGNFATLNTTSANITTVRAANFNTANAVITGGYATGLANISVTGNATVGNLIGTSSNTTIVAGNYSSTFDTVGNVVLPSAFVSGNATVMGIAPGYAPNRPAFRIYGSSSNNWTTSNINFKGSDIVVDYNQGNYFNSTTGVFTAPVAGLYSITLNARVGNNNGQNQIMVLKNGLTSAGNVAVMWECDTNTGTAVHYGVSSVMKLAAGDFLTANITVGNVQFDANDSWTVSYIG